MAAWWLTVLLSPHQEMFSCVSWLTLSLPPTTVYLWPWQQWHFRNSLKMATLCRTAINLAPQNLSWSTLEVKLHSPKRSILFSETMGDLESRWGQVLQWMLSSVGGESFQGRFPSTVVGHVKPCIWGQAPCYSYTIRALWAIVNTCTNVRHTDSSLQSLSNGTSP